MPGTTRRPLTLNCSPAQAAQVTKFMVDVPDKSLRDGGITLGRWRLARFTVSEEQAETERITAVVRASKHDGVGDDLWTRAGTYTALYRHKTDEEMERLGGPPRASLWIPVMSDTFNEIEDHYDPILEAKGRVLIHGLGLGCIVSALIEKPEVSHIDVVEAEADVIALTGRYYEGHPKVTIHHGSCVEIQWSEDSYWDYVWHDIWTEISPRNLDDEEAEHGISYGRLFSMFKDRSTDQGAWAYARCLESQEQNEKEERIAQFWADRWNAADFDTRVDMFVSQVASHPIGGGSFPKEAIYMLLEMDRAAEGQRMIDRIRSRASSDKPMTMEEALLSLGLVDL